MADFLVRVELVKIEGDGGTLYEALHKAMENAKFSRKIKGTQWRWLPHATYRYSDSTETTTATAVRDLAKPVIAAVHADYELLVAAMPDWSSWGLQPVS